MRQDQIARLRDLVEKLADVLLEEADPDTWPGAGMPISEMTKEERGDRYWCKKNAAATFTLLERANSTVNDAEDPNRHRSPDEEADMEKQMSKREKQAEQLLAAAMKKAKQAAHGRQA